MIEAHWPVFGRLKALDGHLEGAGGRAVAGIAVAIALPDKSRTAGAGGLTAARSGYELLNKTAAA